MVFEKLLNLSLWEKKKLCTCVYAFLPGLFKLLYTLLLSSIASSLAIAIALASNLGREEAGKEAAFDVRSYLASCFLSFSPLHLALTLFYN